MDRPIFNSEDGLTTPDSPLGEQFAINGARIVLIETKGKGVFELLEREMRSAARISPIKKRTVLAAIRRLHHKAAHGRFTRTFINRPTGGKDVSPGMEIRMTKLEIRMNVQNPNVQMTKRERGM
jgi:hypothetical protein